MADVVLNPETGRPAVAEVVYRDLERDAEQAQHDAIEAELNAVTSQHDELLSQKAALEGKLADQKSLLEGIDRLAQPATNDGAVDEWSVGADSQEAAPAEAESVLL